MRRWMMGIVGLGVALALAACEDEAARGGASPSPSVEQVMPVEDPSPVDFNQVTLRWSPRLGADQRDFGDAYARAAWVHLHLVAGDWDQARVDVSQLKRELAAVGDRDRVPRDVRALTAAAQPLVTQLSDQVERRDAMAVSTAKKLVTALNRLAGDPAIAAWLNQPPPASTAPSGEPTSPPMAVPDEDQPVPAGSASPKILSPAPTGTE